MRYEIVSSPEGVRVTKVDYTGFMPSLTSSVTLCRTTPLEEILYDLIPFLTGVGVGLHVPAYVGTKTTYGLTERPK